MAKSTGRGGKERSLKSSKKQLSKSQEVVLGKMGSFGRLMKETGMYHEPSLNAIVGKKRRDWEKGKKQLETMRKARLEDLTWQNYISQSLRRRKTSKHASENPKRKIDFLDESDDELDDSDSDDGILLGKDMEVRRQLELLGMIKPIKAIGNGECSNECDGADSADEEEDEIDDEEEEDGRAGKRKKQKKGKGFRSWYVTLEEPNPNPKTKLEKAISSVLEELRPLSKHTCRNVMEALLEKINGPLADNVQPEVFNFLPASFVQSKKARVAKLQAFEFVPPPEVDIARVVPASGMLRHQDSTLPGKLLLRQLEPWFERVEEQNRQKKLKEALDRVKFLLGDAALDTLNITMHGDKVNVIHHDTTGTVNPSQGTAEVEPLSEEERRAEEQWFMGACYDTPHALLPLIRSLPDGILKVMREPCEKTATDLLKRAQVEREFRQNTARMYVESTAPLSSVPASTSDTLPLLPTIPFQCTWCSREFSVVLDLENHFRVTSSCKSALSAVKSSEVLTKKNDAMSADEKAMFFVDSQMPALDGVKLWRQGRKVAGVVQVPPGPCWPNKARQKYANYYRILNANLSYETGSRDLSFKRVKDFPRRPGSKNRTK